MENNLPLDAEWSDEARLTFNRMPIDVQAALITKLAELNHTYSDLYQKRPAGSVAVGTTTHLQAPDWGMWLRLATEYHEDEFGPVLFIHQFEELTPNEFDASVVTSRAQPDRINPANR